MIEITPRYVYTGGLKRVESMLYKCYRPGDQICVDAGAPGYGHKVYVVTHKTKHGLYGVVIEDTMGVY